jgi:transglutaminase-like putative cysteine protease
VQQKLKLCTFILLIVIALTFTSRNEANADEAVLNQAWYAVGNTESYERNIYETAYSMEDLDREIRNNIKNHEEIFTIRYLNDISNLKAGINSIINDVINKDDYIHYTLENYSYVYEGYEGDVTIKFNLHYTETKWQADYVTYRVDEILGEIVTEDMDAYQKEKAIHDYIVLNVKYDTTFTEKSAYAALANGNTVCQGYALLAYKMLNRAGIETRIIEGTAEAPHLWNLVQLDGRWYHLDCTWDDPVSSRDDFISYKYFNLTDEQIRTDHSWVNNFPQAL